MRAHSVHKKCDAKQPCTTCANKGKGATCKYEVSRPRGDAPRKPPTSPPRDDLLPWSDSCESGPSHFLPLDLPEKSSAPPEQSGRQLLPLKLDKAASDPLSDASVVEKALSDLRPDVFSFTILPSINFRAIPRPLRMPFSLVPPELVQVSCVAGSDLDMTLCVFSLRFRKFHLAEGLKVCSLAAA